MKMNKNFTDKETFKPRPELSTGVTMKTSEEKHPGRTRKCKGFKWEAFLVSWKNREEAKQKRG